VAAVGVAFAAFLLVRYGAGVALLKETGLPALLFAVMVFAVAALLLWAYRGWRLHRATDPWAYDPELDGPIAEAVEGRSFPPPAKRTALPGPVVAAWVLVALIFALAGFWLFHIANATYGAANGAEGPSLLPLALYLAGLVFEAAVPFTLWHAFHGHTPVADEPVIEAQK
jgi:hypothetical protein